MSEAHGNVSFKGLWSLLAGKEVGGVLMMMIMMTMMIMTTTTMTTMMEVVVIVVVFISTACFHRSNA